MTGIAVEVLKKETAGIIVEITKENVMKALMTVADRNAASRNGQPGGPD